MGAASHLSRFAAQALDVIASSQGRPPFTTAQRLSFLVGLCGVDVVDVAGAPLDGVVHETWTVIYRDPQTSHVNYQTACVPTYRSETPFVLQLLDGSHGRLFSRDRVASFAGIDLRTGFDVQIHARVHAPSNHYFSRVDPDLNILPTAILASPYSACGGGCKMCARAAARTFSKPSAAYIKEHVRLLRDDFAERGWETQDLWSVNLVTGCQPTVEHELEMMLGVMGEYHHQGFGNAKFHIYSYHLKTTSHMRALLEARAIGYIGTLETFDDTRRATLWGRDKGGQSLADHHRRYALAHELGFAIVETNYVIGTDSHETMIKGVAELDRVGVVVVPNVARSYNLAQLSSQHTDLWAMGFQYVLDGFEACVKTYRHPSIKHFAGTKAVEYLNSRGRQVSLADLPIRHT